MATISFRAGSSRPSARFRNRISRDGIRFRFIDLFAGIGGFRVGLEAAGGRCVFSSEKDKYCQRTYEAWFGECPAGDINEIDPNQIPEHDLLAAGFPCQPFSRAGLARRRHLSRSDGLACPHQGNMFFRICDIIDRKRPAVVFLENTKNLRTHDRGRTWRIMRKALESRRYQVYQKIIDASAYVPQRRERMFIISFDRRVFGKDAGFRFPLIEGAYPSLATILEKSPANRYTLTDRLWSFLQTHAEKHRAKGNGFGFGLASRHGVTRTLTARYYKDGSEILIPQHGRNPRRLTVPEAARLMGFGQMVRARTDMPVSDTQAYKQLGNAVVPALVKTLAQRIVTHLSPLGPRSRNVFN